MSTALREATELEAGRLFLELLEAGRFITFFWDDDVYSLTWTDRDGKRRPNGIAESPLDLLAEALGKQGGKKCRVCKRDRPLGDYYPCPRYTDGRWHTCRTCEVAVVQARKRKREAAKKLKAADQGDQTGKR